MGLDLKDGLLVIRRLVKEQDRLKKLGVLGEYEGVMLSNVAAHLEDCLKYPDKDMNAIHGENPYLGWLILSAFRYSVGRHPTQAMWGIEGVICDNSHLLCDDFIQQMIDDIENEFRIYELRDDRDKGTMGNPYYLKRLQDNCIKELERRNGL